MDGASSQSQTAPSSPQAASHSLSIERIFDAPRDVVFAAWTSAELMLRWMGPEDHPAVDLTQDLRVGGRWTARLRPRAGGADLLQGGVFQEIAPPSRLAFTFAWESDNHEDGPGVETLVTIDLLEEGRRTRMIFCQSGLVSAQSASGHTAGWTSTFDRLADDLEKSRRDA